MESLAKRLIDGLCRVQRLGTLLLDPSGEIFTALGRWQNMSVAIDGGASGSADCDLRDLKTFTSPLRVSAGVHRIAIQFSNSLLIKNGDCSQLANHFEEEIGEAREDDSQSSCKVD